jgi:hypothetical protein
MPDAKPRSFHPFAAAALLAGAVIVSAEWLRRTSLESLPPHPRAALAAAVAHYDAVRGYALANAWWLIPVAVAAVVVLVLTLRRLLLWRHNTVVAKLAGTELETTQHGFPKLRFDLLEELRRTPNGKYFVGLDRRRRPVYLSEWDLDTHGHIMGHTGSGKTRSVPEPLMLQDLAHGKGLLFMDAKGSNENVQTMKALAAVTRRSAELKVFALANPEWSHTYNPVFLGPGGDPLATAERVFSVFPLEHEYYRRQSKLFFYNLVRLLAGTGQPFNLRDVRLAVADIVLQHVQAVGALRQIDRGAYDQTPFAVCVDELNRFAFPELVPSLAMLRDAHVQFRLSHQSLGDLEQVDEVFARQVKDNTRWKVYSFENDPDHLEKVSRSYGTRTAFKKTVRYSLGPLLTFLNTGEVSNREVEEFVLHPNALKSLGPQGQGYLLLPNRMSGISFEMLPRFEVPDHPLPKRAAPPGLDLYARFVAGAPHGATAPCSGSEASVGSF